MPGRTRRGGLGAFFLNSFVIVFPAVIIPISLALLAAYCFAWIDFTGRNFLFVAVFALQIVPIQVTLIPLQTIFVNFGLQNSFWPVWISHTIFGLPLAIFLLHNFMKEVPGVDRRGRPGGRRRARQDLLRRAACRCWSRPSRPSASSSSCGSGTTCWWRSCSRPARTCKPITAAIAELSGTKGSQWELLSAGAFISIVVPLAVFLGLQRYFVRGLLAGGVKG